MSGTHWPLVVEIKAQKMIGDRLAEVRVPLSVEMLDDTPLGPFLRHEIDGAFDKLEREQ